MSKYKALSNIVRSITRCKRHQIYKQLFVTAALFKAIRHKIYLKTSKNIRYFKQKSKSRSETLKIPSLVSYETKLEFVEIVIISVSDLAPAIGILEVIIFSIRFGKRVLFMLVTYITKYNDHYFNHCVAWFYTFVKQ